MPLCIYRRGFFVPREILTFIILFIIKIIRVGWENLSVESYKPSMERKSHICLPPYHLEKE